MERQGSSNAFSYWLFTQQQGIGYQAATISAAGQVFVVLLSLRIQPNEVLEDDTLEQDLNQQAREILEIAQRHGVEQNFFFLTTFKRYQVQINILNELEKRIRQDGTLVTKEYVKGRQNIYTHPAVSEYNKTATTANQTVQTLIKIILSLRNEDDAASEILEFIQNGRRN